MYSSELLLGELTPLLRNHLSHGVGIVLDSVVWVDGCVEIGFCGSVVRISYIDDSSIDMCNRVQYSIVGSSDVIAYSHKDKCFVSGFSSLVCSEYLSCSIARCFISSIITD